MKTQIEWIRVEDAKPEPHVSVLVTLQTTDNDAAMVELAHFWKVGSVERWVAEAEEAWSVNEWSVIAWAYLPEPYEPY